MHKTESQRLFSILSLVIFAITTLILTNVFYALCWKKCFQILALRLIFFWRFITLGHTSNSQTTIRCAEEFSSTEPHFEETFFSSPKTHKTTAVCLIVVPQSLTNTSEYFFKNVLVPLKADPIFLHNFSVNVLLKA